MGSSPTMRNCSPYEHRFCNCNLTWTVLDRAAKQLCYIKSKVTQCRKIMKSNQNLHFFWILVSAVSNSAYIEVVKQNQIQMRYNYIQILIFKHALDYFPTLKSWNTAYMFSCLVLNLSWLSNPLDISPFANISKRILSRAGINPEREGLYSYVHKDD